MFLILNGIISAGLITKKKNKEFDMAVPVKKAEKITVTIPYELKEQL